MIRFIRDLSLGVKLNIIIFAVLAVAVALTVILVDQIAVQLMEDTGREQLESEAAAIQSGLNQAEDQTLTNANLLANSPGLVQAVIERDVNTVRTIVLTTAAAATFDEIEIVDANGASLTTYAADAGSSYRAAADDMLSLGLLGIEASGVITGSAENDLLLVGVTTLRDDQGNIVGALIAGQALDAEFLRSLALHREDIHLAVIQGGEIITTTETGHEYETTIKPRLLQLARTGQVATDNEIVYDSEGTPHIQAIIPMGTRKTSADTFIVAYVDLTRLQTFQRNVLTFMAIGVALSGLVVVGTIALFAWRSIVIPLGKLKKVASTMAGGDYAQRFTVTSTDEVGQLGTAFNEMAEAVQQRQVALQDLAETLEQRVRNRTRQLEQANREAREASRLKDEFLAIMSHELRTPLNAIIGYQGILEMMGGLEEKNAQRVKRTRANAERLLNLIDDILDISRIESGRLQVVPSQVFIRDLVDGLRGQMDVLAAEKDLRFDIQIDTDVPDAIWVDEDAVTKIITNLLSNAFKFTTQGKVALYIRRDDSNWQIKVTDTGLGIPAHMHEIIFERFRQVDSSTKREYGGTGLGLAIARQLAAAIGGTIRVDSTPGQGSTFTVTLPLESEPAPELASAL